jgi:hypothetical protein
MAATPAAWFVPSGVASDRLSPTIAKYLIKTILGHLLEKFLHEKIAQSSHFWGKKTMASTSDLRGHLLQIVPIMDW